MIHWADFPSGSNGLYGSSGSADMLDGLWAEVTGAGCVDDPDASIGANGTVLIFNASNGTARRVLNSAQATVGVACRLWLPSLPTVASAGGRPMFVQWRDGSNNTIAYAYVNDTGGISFVNGSTSNAAPTASSSGPVVTANGWWHVESELTCSTVGAGAVEIRVNGVPVVTASGLTTSAATCAQYAAVRASTSSNHSPNFYLKDIVPWDSTGTFNNDFLGAVSVFFRVVDSDISLGDWTLSSGTTGFSLIGVEGPANDSNYIAADPTDLTASEFTLQDLPADITSVRAVIPIVRATKVDGGDGSIQISISPNGTDYDVGPDTPITAAMTYWGNATSPFVSEDSPATGVAWTPAEFNSARMRIDRTL